MKTMRMIICVLLALGIMVIPITASAAKQGTDGDELHLMQPEKLVIQLGEEWAGVEFELKTDVGMYPEKVPVGKDGVLRLEIGGSTTYTQTCFHSAVKVPEPGEPLPEETGTYQGAPSAPATTEKESTSKSVGGIPVKNLVIFGGGLFVAIAGLITLNMP